MADKTGIEWTEATWNPVVGCTHVSEGCENCYAAREASGRLRNLPTYAGLAVGGRFTGEVRLLPDRLDQPLRWRRPRRIFVNSMSDLFHRDVPDEYIAKVFAVMAASPRHAFQVLTKRPGRMRSLLSSDAFPALVRDQAVRYLAGYERPAVDRGKMPDDWPLPNVWLGVSVENQHWADVRIPPLLDTPAAVWWLSCEPLLGPVDLTAHLTVPVYNGSEIARRADRYSLGRSYIGWVVVGGESGPGARPMYPGSASDLRDQCVAADVPFLFKQWGEWVRGGAAAVMVGADGSLCPTRGDLLCTLATMAASDPDHLHTLMSRVGKKAAGRELDGRTWDEYPAVAG